MRPEVYREMAAVQASHWWFAARRRILARLIPPLLPDAQAEILEIGCGTGANLALLAGLGRLSAMEYEPEAAALARALGVCPVQPGGLPAPVPFDDGRFALVCLLDVLEHIADDRAALARAARLLAPGGRLLVTVPAYRWLWSAHDTAHQHHRRYTAASLRGVAEAAGLRVQRIGHFNTLLFPLIALARLAQRLRGAADAEGSDARLPPAPLNQLLEAVFASERFVLPRVLLPFGVSVLAVLECEPGAALPDT
ncbi:MAG: methyltransferase domain-containing protein [Burkholderiales bacterium]|nr:methyltransferase domain-containing protein [Burkholderiales bacterium]